MKFYTKCYSQVLNSQLPTMKTLYPPAWSKSGSPNGLVQKYQLLLLPYYKEINRKADLPYVFFKVHIPNIKWNHFKYQLFQIIYALC